MGKIFYIMGKSSSGKDTIYGRLLQDEDMQLKKLILHTTRPMREGEQDGREYHFVQKEIGYLLVNLMKDVTPYLLITIGAIVISHFCLIGCTNIYLKFVGKIGTVALLYLSAMWATGSQTLKEGLDYLLKGKKV